LNAVSETTERVRIALAQNAITPDVSFNGAAIRDAMTRAAASGADLVQFPEGALSGYVKAQVKDWSAVDWVALDAEISAIRAHAAHLGIAAIVGSNRPGPPGERPRNALHAIDPGGTMSAYDKRILSASEERDWYGHGTRRLVAEAGGFSFGLALCIEVHFPELFADYEAAGADAVLVSAYSDDPLFADLVRAHAAMNTVWATLVVPANCAARCPSRCFGPNGHELARCGDGEDLVVVTLDRTDPAFDIALTRAKPWRRMARTGFRERSRHRILPAECRP